MIEIININVSLYLCLINYSTHNHNSGGGSYSQRGIGPGSALSTVREDGNQGNSSIKPGEDEGDLGFPQEASAGGKAMALMFQAKDLEEQVR